MRIITGRTRWAPVGVVGLAHRYPCLLFFAAASLLPAGCGGPVPVGEVIVYTSVDQFYSEPIFREFESATGIEVRPVYDVEAVKTTGLVQRILSEASHPQADVFWNNEFAQSIYLAEKGVLSPLGEVEASGIREAFRDSAGIWIPLGCRYRVFLIRKGLEDPPKDVEDLPTVLSRLRVGMAQPAFGTTATWAASLRAQWGPERSSAYLSRLVEGGIRVVAGNSLVRDMVVSGALDLGLTDSDDACMALRRGAPVEVLPARQGGAGPMPIPGSLALIRGAPHRKQALQLIRYLLRPEVEQQLIEIGAFQASVRVDGPRSSCIPEEPGPFPLSLSAIADELAGSHLEISRIFLR